METYGTQAEAEGGSPLLSRYTCDVRFV
jgi:hypothetical protein